MSTIEIILGIIVLFSSTCFGYAVGKNVGFKEGITFCASLMSKLTFKVEEGEDDDTE